MSLEENLRIQRTLTLAKFHVDTTRPTSRNRLITKTLGKIGVISADYNGVAPNDEEFWLCGFHKEVTKSAANPCSGLFILKPIRYVDRCQINYLTLGLYTYEDDGGIRYVIPKYKNMYWLMSIEERRRLIEPSRIHSIVVVNYNVLPSTAALEKNADPVYDGIRHYVPDEELSSAAKDL